MADWTKITPLNIFYEEPDPDRWVRYDRYPRWILRRIVRGESRPGSIMMIALGLMKGLDILGVQYRFNDRRHIQKHPEDPACIIGKPHVLDKYNWKNPVIFGSGIFSHPDMYPDLLLKHPNIKKILVPGPWVKEMFSPFYGADKVITWPTGIDTDKWAPSTLSKSKDILIYCKFLWDKDQNVQFMLNPILRKLEQLRITYQIITYGHYLPDDLQKALSVCRSAIFLCEHESQGFAYQQILSSGIPILAWDRADVWLDPYFYPHKVNFGPTSSVPYWDDRCGMKFRNITEFGEKLEQFMSKVTRDQFDPRAYVLENLTLDKCAQKYLDIVYSIDEDPSNS